MRSRTLLPILLIALAALLVGGCGKPPLVPEAPRGSAQWLPNIAMACTTSTTDASGAQVSYQFDWGDGNKSQWSQYMNGGLPYADTHSYANFGSYQIKVRAKNSKKASGWSEPLSINVVAEGHVVWSIFFTDPEDPEDSTDFSLNSFAIGSDNTAYVACGGVLGTVGAVIARRSTGVVPWKFTTTNLDPFTAAPLLADDGTIYIGCSDDFIYAINSNGTMKWRDSVGMVNAAGALAADGTVYFQTEDTMVVALRPDGSTAWTFFTGGGNSAPVVGADGTVYAVSQDGTVFAINPADGIQKWADSLRVPVVQAPAINPGRDTMYVMTETGELKSIDVNTGANGWSRTIGEDASGPVIGPDGGVYVGGGGRLLKLTPQLDTLWAFVPPLAGGIVSTPALAADGYVYALVVQPQKSLALQQADSLYAVNPDGTRRWACGLGEGFSDPEYPLSAPKLDANGYIYVGDGFRAWCVAGISAPAQSIWPMFQHDAQNTGRAR